MKSFASLPLIFISFCSLGQSHQGPAIAWDKNTYDFGDIIQGEKVEHTFKYHFFSKLSGIIIFIQKQQKNLKKNAKNGRITLRECCKTHL